MTFTKTIRFHDWTHRVHPGERGRVVRGTKNTFAAPHTAQSGVLHAARSHCPSMSSSWLFCFFFRGFFDCWIVPGYPGVKKPHRNKKTE